MALESGSPERDLRGDLVGRAMRLTADGVVDRAGDAGLAALRRDAPREGPQETGLVDLRLPHRPPLDAEALMAFLGARAVPGVEEVADGAYRRSLRLPHGAGVVRPATGRGPGAGPLCARGHA